MNTIEQLKNSARKLAQTRPAYREILDFYVRVFELQENRLADISPDPIRIDPELLKLKKENHMPLIEPSQFRIQTDSATGLLKEICDLSQSYAQDLAGDGRRILRALEDRTLDAGQLFNAILGNDPAALSALAEKIRTDAAKLKLFGYLSIAPSIYAGAQQLATYLETDRTFEQGYCPVCGDKPDLAILDENGRQTLKCSFCRHQWPVKRTGCAFCDSSAPEKQQYFFSNEEKEYRVNLCDDCGNYIKVIDLRQMNRFFYPGIEVISTLHLDFKAREKGYTSLVDL